MDVYPSFNEEDIKKRCNEEISKFEKQHIKLN